MRFARIAVSAVLLWGSANDVTAGREADESLGTSKTTSPPVAGAKHAPEPASLIRTRNRGDHLASSPHASTFPDEGRLVTNRQQRRNDADDRHNKYYRHRRSSPQQLHLNDSAQREHTETLRIQPHRRYNKNAKQAPDDRSNPLTEEESQPEALEEGRLRTITSPSSHQAESQEGPETNMRPLNHREQDAITHILPDHPEATSIVKRQRRRLRRRSRQQQENQHNMHTHAHHHHRHTVSEEVTTATSTAHGESSSADANNSQESSSPIPTHILSSHPNLLSRDAVLVRGHQTHLCWTVDNGRYDIGTLIVLDECDVANSHQYFLRENYSYDVETDSYSWLWRPIGWELLESDSDDTSSRNSGKSQSNTRKSTLYVVGHKYTLSADSTHSNHGGRWRMVLDELPEGVTDPLTQVFWTIGSPSQGNDIVRTTSSSTYGVLESDIDVDLMGMGQHAYSTRLFVANEGDVAEVDAPVVLRTETSIHEAVERARTLARTPIRHGLDQFEEEVYQLNGHYEDNELAVNTGATMVDGGTVAGVIPGKWSYIRVA